MQICFPGKLFVTLQSSCTLKHCFRYSTVSQKDYSDAACYAMAILGHGKEGIISVANGEVKLDRIISKVKKCHNLQGKPKLFFVQVSLSEYYKYFTVNGKTV